MSWRWSRRDRSREYLADTITAIERRRQEAAAIAAERRNAHSAVRHHSHTTPTVPSWQTPPVPTMTEAKIIQHDATAFHLPTAIEPVPGLVEDIKRLRDTGRPSAALDVVLRVLRDDSRSAGAYECALLLCSGRTARSQAAEPITEQQLRNPLLDPVRTVCTSCGSEWFSHHELVHNTSALAVTNPLGLQCQVCRYTLCRNCFTADRECPQPGCAGVLDVPVLATGKPAALRLGKIEYLVSVVEQGAPKPEELLESFYSSNLGISLTGAGFWPRTAYPGVDDTFGYFLVMNLEQEGRVRPGALDRTRLATSHHPSFGIVRFYLIVAPTVPDTATPPQRWDGDGTADLGRF
jgi:hypothetical protein